VQKQEKKYISLNKTVCYFHLVEMLTSNGSMLSMLYLKKNMMAREEFQLFYGDRLQELKKRQIVHQC
jgi:hypothetical protein